MISENVKKIIIEAIHSRRQISFDYKSNGVIRNRIGNPYALFYHLTTGKLTVDLFQTGGYSSSSRNIYDWRDFLVEKIINIQIVTGNVFDVRMDYNSNSTKYSKWVVKI